MQGKEKKDKVEEKKVRILGKSIEERPKEINNIQDWTLWNRYSNIKKRKGTIAININR